MSKCPIPPDLCLIVNVDDRERQPNQAHAMATPGLGVFGRQPYYTDRFAPFGTTLGELQPPTATASRPSFHGFYPRAGISSLTTSPELDSGHGTTLENRRLRSGTRRRDSRLLPLSGCHRLQRPTCPDSNDKPSLPYSTSPHRFSAPPPPEVPVLTYRRQEDGHGAFTPRPSKK